MNISFLCFSAFLESTKNSNSAKFGPAYKSESLNCESASSRIDKWPYTQMEVNKSLLSLHFRLSFMKNELQLAVFPCIMDSNKNSGVVG